MVSMQSPKLTSLLKTMNPLIKFRTYLLFKASGRSTWFGTLSKKTVPGKFYLLLPIWRVRIKWFGPLTRRGTTLLNQVINASWIHNWGATSRPIHMAPVQKLGKIFWSQTCFQDGRFSSGKSNRTSSLFAPISSKEAFMQNINVPFVKIEWTLISISFGSAQLFEEFGSPPT